MALLLAAAATFAQPAAANPDGSVDTGWGGVEFGRVRVAFNTGANNYDYPIATRVLGDGRLVVVGMASVTTTQRQIAVAVRRPDGSADTSVAPGGRYTIPVTGVLTPGHPAAIAADGSFYVIGLAPSQQQLRIWHHALDGTQLAAPLDVGPAGSTAPDSALLDSAGRLLVGGHARPAGSGADSANDGFVVRLAGGAVDPAFGGFRSVPFDPGRRDDVFAMTQVGENYALCGRVGDLADSTGLGFGIALVSRSGSLLASFNGNGMYVDQLALNGSAAESACNSIAAVRSGSATRLVITGRAYVPAQPARAFLLAVGLDGQLIAGTPRMIDFGQPTTSTGGFPQLLAAGRETEPDRLYLMSSGYYDAGTARMLAVARVDSLGNYDTGWGDGATGTRITMSAPAIGGSPRDLTGLHLSLGQGRLHVGAAISLDAGDSDFALIRLSGDHLFADGFD
ncbi:hypothetical protein [Tahibacter caeni]|uniref:hypothetical protein n=1 Tax=Tahibacter caeni TaxID=1453545 RepID=UPI0021489614|nr:hypothetical protein [Tahibacter caeni]